MSILSLILMILQMLPAILQSAGVITPAMAKLVADLAAAIPNLIEGLVSGKNKTDDAIAVLRSFQVEIAKLQADTTLSPSALALASTLNQATTEALAAYEAAGETCDPSTLTPLPTSL